MSLTMATLAIIAVVFAWARQASAETAPDVGPNPEPGPGPSPGPGPDTNPEKGATGSDPTNIPTQGKFYRVQDGDSLSAIAQRAGLGGPAWRKIRDHEENAWMPQSYSDGRTFAGVNERALPLYRWFDAPGYKTDCEWRTAPGNLFPSIYIPVRAT